jgi:predicted small lipoprotein YifL
VNHRRTTGVRLVAATICAAAALITTAACGKKGPPLPPLNRVPAAPGDFAVTRRADRVDIQLTVPAANTDGTRPANIVRVEVYAYTGPSSITDDQIWRLGSRLASFPVKTPRDPNETIEPDDPVADLEPLEGLGLDQGAVVSTQETVTPLPASAGDAASRMYVSVGVARNGRKGLLSRRGRVPLAPAPPPPSAPTLAYDEKNVTITWTPLAPEGAAAGATIAGYHVYDVSPRPEARPPSPDRPPSPEASPAPAVELPLTSSPVADPRFVDARIEWGATRCYAVRSVETVDGASIESAPSRASCVELIDTFAPSPPKGLSVLPSSGGTSMQLIWDSNSEPDLAGYVVLRGVVPAETLAPITPAPIAEPSFTDTVQPGTRYVYAVQAVDKSGNRSVPSERKEETAR